MTRVELVLGSTRRDSSFVRGMVDFGAGVLDAVFALTDPEVLKRWFGPTEGHAVPVAEVDLRVGGCYRIDLRGPSGTLYRIVGAIEGGDVGLDVDRGVG